MKAKFIIIALLLAGGLWLTGCEETEGPSERDAKMERERN